MGGGGGSSQKWEAGDLYANVAREEFNLTHALGDPIQQQLSQMLKGRSVPETLRMADTSVDNAFDAQRGALGMDLAREGVTMSQAEKAAVDNQFGLQKATASSSLRNSARMHVLDRDMGIMAGSVGNNVAAQMMKGNK